MTNGWFNIMYMSEDLPTVAGGDVFADDIAMTEGGETIYGYDIKLNDLPGGAVDLTGATVVFTYDVYALEFIRAEGFSYNWSTELSNGVLTAKWTGDAVHVENGDTIATLYFARASGVDTTEIRFTVNTDMELSRISYVSNGQDESTEVRTVNGSITFTMLLGDVDCNGHVTMADVSALAAYLMNSGTISERGFINADANQDGAVDILDAPAICAIVLSSN